MRRDPPRGPDCAHCRKPMPTITKATRKYAGDQIDRDPFCSTDCCRAYHGAARTITEAPGWPKGETRAYVQAA